MPKPSNSTAATAAAGTSSRSAIEPADGRETIAARSPILALGKLRSAMRRRDERMAERLSIEPGIVFGDGILGGFRGLKRVGQRFDLQSLHRIGGERPSSGNSVTARNTYGWPIPESASLRLQFAKSKLFGSRTDSARPRGGPFGISTIHCSPRSTSCWKTARSLARYARSRANSLPSANGNVANGSCPLSSRLQDRASHPRPIGGELLGRPPATSDRCRPRRESP